MERRGYVRGFMGDTLVVGVVTHSVVPHSNDIIVASTLELRMHDSLIHSVHHNELKI